MVTKYLIEQELKEFLQFCDKQKIKQKDIANICGEYPSSISKSIANNRFKRAYAKLVVMIKKEELKKDFDLEF